MTILEQVEATLRESRNRAILQRVSVNIAKFSYVVERAERNAGELGWTAHFSAEADGKTVGGLRLVVVTPEPLSFDRAYTWPMLSVFPWWAEYRRENVVVRVSSTS